MLFKCHLCNQNTIKRTSQAVSGRQFSSCPPESPQIRAPPWPWPTPMVLPKQYQETTLLNLLSLLTGLKTLGEAPAIPPSSSLWPLFHPQQQGPRTFAHSAPWPRTLSSALQTCLAPPHALPRRASSVILYLALSLLPWIAQGSITKSGSLHPEGGCLLEPP